MPETAWNEVFYYLFESMYFINGTSFNTCSYLERQKHYIVFNLLMLIHRENPVTYACRFFTPADANKLHVGVLRL